MRVAADAGEMETWIFIMLIWFLNSTVAAEKCHRHDLRMEGSDMMTMTYVLEVKTSMKAAKLEFLTSMLWKEAASLLEFKKKDEKHHKTTQQVNCDV